MAKGYDFLAKQVLHLQHKGVRVNVQPPMYGGALHSTRTCSCLNTKRSSPCFQITPPLLRSMGQGTLGQSLPPPLVSAAFHASAQFGD